MDTLREVAEWVENHEGDVTTLIGRIDAHEEAIDLINDPVVGILAQAIAYTDTMTGSLPAATVDTLGLVKIDDDTVKLNEDNQIYIICTRGRILYGRLCIKREGDLYS